MVSSYRDLKEILLERGVKVEHSSIYRWLQYYTPKILSLDGTNLNALLKKRVAALLLRVEDK